MSRPAQFVTLRLGEYRAGVSRAKDSVEAKKKKNRNNNVKMLHMRNVCYLTEVRGEMKSEINDENGRVFCFQVLAPW